MEIEAKFTLPNLATYQMLNTITAIGAWNVGLSETHILGDTYLDTEQQHLQNAGYVCRMRHVDDQFLITLTSLSSAVSHGIHKREEYEFSLDDATDLPEWPDNEIKQIVQALIDGHDLITVLQLQQTRTVIPIIQDDDIIARMSLDVVNQQVDNHQQTYYELEVELTDAGTEENLNTIIDSLKTQYPLTTQPLSKYQRGMQYLREIQGKTLSANSESDDAVFLNRIAQLANSYGKRAKALIALQNDMTQIDAGRIAGLSERRVRYWLAEYRERGLAIFPDKVLTQISADIEEIEPSPVELDTVSVPVESVNSPGLSPDDTMAEAARKTLKFHFDIMLERETGTRLDKDIEELHEMRVATRRMRSAFRVFKGYYNVKKMAPYIVGIKHTGRVLGVVRDMDVYEAKTKKYISTSRSSAQHKPNLKPMMKAWNNAHKQARGALIDYLDSNDYQKFVRNFGRFLDRSFNGKKSRPSGKNKPHLVRHVVPVLIYQRLAEVRSFDEWMQKKNIPFSRYHELRIATKYLRYTLEFFQEVLGPETAQAIAELKEFQDHLGDLQDAIIASGRLRNFWIWGTWDAPKDGATPRIDAAPIIAPDVASYHAVKQREIQALLAEFPTVWQAFTHSDFSQLIAKAVSVL